MLVLSSAWIAAVTRSATADGVEASSLPSRCRNASPWTSAQVAVAIASASASGKTRRTISRRCSATAAVAAVRSSLSRSQGSPEHDPEQGRSLQRELHVGDLRRSSTARGVCRGEGGVPRPVVQRARDSRAPLPPTRALRDRRSGGRGRLARPGATRNRAQRQRGLAALFEQFHRGADTRRWQIAVVVGRLGLGHRPPMLAAVTRLG